jgi:hypothetical protein
LALNTRGIIDPRWPYHNRAIRYSLNAVDIQIFNPEISEDTYDPETNSWSADTTVLWEGRAQLKTVRSPASRVMKLNPSSVQEVEFHIDFNGNALEGSEGEMPELRPNYQIFVTSSPFDAQLETFIYNITGVVNDSLSWHRVITCEVDQEMKRNIVA